MLEWKACVFCLSWCLVCIKRLSCQCSWNSFVCSSLKSDIDSIIKMEHFFNLLKLSSAFDPSFGCCTWHTCFTAQCMLCPLTPDSMENSGGSSFMSQWAVFSLGLLSTQRYDYRPTQLHCSPDLNTKWPTHNCRVDSFQILHIYM